MTLTDQPPSITDLQGFKGSRMHKAFGKGERKSENFPQLQGKSTVFLLQRSVF